MKEKKKKRMILSIDIAGAYDSVIHHKLLNILKKRTEKKKYGWII